jgi:uncharacterized protein (TIGR00299 family) protein
MFLLLDTFSGIAGDMAMAALVDLGVPIEALRDAVAALGVPGIVIQAERVSVASIAATRVTVHCTKPQPQRNFADISALLSASKLDDETRTLAAQIFRRLAEAEAEVHGATPEDVHFHEVGAYDSLADIVGVARALTYVGAELVSTPLPMGRGFVRCQHGTLPLPAPGTLAALRGVPTYDAGIDGELVTPTGAAIVAVTCRRFERWPTFTPLRSGWGAGTRVLPDRPNVLRVVLGSAPVGQVDWVQVEANVDDLTGELAAVAITKLFEAGAADAWAVPITMKKGRPALTVAALCRAALESEVSATMLRETTSIGLRRHVVSRTERPRRTVSVTTRFGTVSVKVSEGPYGPAQLKPEFDECVARAAEHGVPVRVVVAEALSAAWSAALGAPP